MNINYEKIQQSINEYGNYILNCIKNQYSSSLIQGQLQNINSLLNTNFIVIERPTKEDIAFFSKQEQKKIIKFIFILIQNHLVIAKVMKK